MNIEWKNINESALKNATIILIRISDNVLYEEDWPVHTLRYEGGLCVEQRAETQGVYTIEGFVGRTIKALKEWSNLDKTGHHPEMFHEICILL